jgi:chromosome segregation protein
VTAPARLLSLRLQGFKSFAERTIVEFGPGISAVVGPNGSGKSNLADGLRWALGEQGRALRSRRSEDVIWAGSDRRAALGMADVTLMLDNADGLLPVEFSAIELGRRLYRSGENDYLLNRQRVRLRDLVEMLDAANLADNAFLFIGQGMVDQALSLRPEERRPLFEEVAGVRRHERRRRRAEEQLAESEVNLARVQDIVAELRPQARRLAAQAEQQATRATAGTQLAEALVVSAHARWHDAAARLNGTKAEREAAARETDRISRELRRREDAAAAIAAQLASRVTLEEERRGAHETARAALNALQLSEARLAADVAATERDRERLGAERAAAEANVAAQRRALALPVPDLDPDTQAALAEAERALGEAVTRLADMRAERQSQGEAAAALRQAEAARQAETEASRRRLADVERRTADEETAFRAADERRVAAGAAVRTATEALTHAAAAEERVALAREEARAAADDVERARGTVAERSSALAARLAAAEGRLEALDARLSDEETRWLARSARRHGGRRVDEELVIDAPLRRAAEAALGVLTRAFVVERSVIPALDGERGAVVVAESLGALPRLSSAERSVRERASQLGGGSLADAVRRDPTGAATGALARVLWLPDLDACLAIQRELPAGWSGVTRDGSAVVGNLAAILGAPEATLDVQAEAASIRGDVERLREQRRRADDELARATASADAARERFEAARADEAAAIEARRRAEESERVVARALEAAVRETSWHEAQLARLRTELERARALHQQHEARAGAFAVESPNGGDRDDALAAWETRVAELRARRDELAADQAVREAARRDAESKRARAEATIALDEERMARADRETAALAERSASLLAQRDRLAGEIADASAAEARTRAVLNELQAADTADRDRLAAADRAVSETRDLLREVEERLRAADRADLEARLGIDSLREQVLVELAGLGELGLRQLRASAAAAATAANDDAASTAATFHAAPRAQRDGVTTTDPDEGDDAGEAAALEGALDEAAARWASEAPSTDIPSSQRLAMLRRRFHELGAPNPFAVEEYAEIRTRLETLETQERDLRAAITSTRQLIDELNSMIGNQFTSTFRALESAFERRFNQLFGGGFARLSLTDPDDLAGSGVEIVARPPGKKAQGLAMLSGGERALTAVALLFAMLEVRPVPFCVLDEVDAALDEANVGRFVDALRSLSQQTQFIVITHNRGTIEAADALYGVTVGDDSVSRVISLRLEEARAIAAQRAGRETAATLA